MISEKAIELIKLHEGLRLTPYKDTEGIVTIGYGRNLDHRGISPLEAEQMLTTDIMMATIECSKMFYNFFRHSDTRQAVLIDMMFNLGYTRLGSFKNMIAALEAQMYQVAAKEMLDSKWARQVKTRAHRLSQIMKTGKYVAS